MRLSRPPTLLSLLAIVLSSAHTSGAKPLPRDNTSFESQDNTLIERSCANPCGYTGQLCCGVNQLCLTVAGQAQCGDGTAAVVSTVNGVAANGQWQLYTTTYVETGILTVTSTYSSLYGSSTAQVVATPTTVQAPTVTGLICSAQYNEIPCGAICCAVGQYCQYQGQCAAAAGVDVSSSYLSSITAAGSASAFIRPTSDSVQTITSTGSATTTVPFGTPTPTATGGSSTTGLSASTTNNGLSGGAIAGIVIGVLAGIILLLIICGCFCFKGILDGFLSLLGLGPKRKVREETYIEERRSHHGASGGGGRTWYGAQRRPNRVDRPKKSGGMFGGFTGVAAGLAALAVILGLKRRRDRKEKSNYTGSSYSYSDYTSASSESSDRRTRDSRRSRR